MKTKTILLLLILFTMFNQTYGQIIVPPDLKPIEIPGRTMSDPIDIGDKSSSFTYSNTFDVIFSSDTYQGTSGRDIYYKFKLTVPMDIVISHCDSELSVTHAYLLDTAGNLIVGSNSYSNTDGCVSAQQAYMKVMSLPAGTYYVVSEGGVATTGYIVTCIEGVILTGSGDDEVDIHPDDGWSREVSLSKNHILTITPTVTTISAQNLSPAKSMQSVQYIDGLGRPTESVWINATPDSSDLVSYQEYDLLGRESNRWQSTVFGNNDGAFILSADFKTQANNIHADSKPYFRSVYENSPLGRVLERYDPGQAWHDNGKSVKTTYLTNTSGYVCRNYVISDNRKGFELSCAGNYITGQLYVIRLTDEDGNISYEFKNKSGEVVLTRQMEGSVAHDTYYVYDSYGNLRTVLPPLAADAMSSGTWNGSEIFLQQYAYLYKYDEYNRQIAKKLPGAEWIYYIYDKEDQLILTQDGVQRSKSPNEWTFQIPDIFGRIVLTGICQNIFDYESDPLKDRVVATRTHTTNVYKGYSFTGVNLFGLIIIQTVNYYDDYRFMGFNNIPSIIDESFKPETVDGYGTCDVTKTQGLQTGALVLLLKESGGLTYIPTVIYYDYRGRLVQVKSKNHLNDGLEKEYMDYTFSGKPQKKMHIHSATGKVTQTNYYTYEYDHAERMTQVRHQLRSGTTLHPEVTLADYAYDNLGRLQTKSFHGIGTDPVTYTYNIRDWLTGIIGSKFTQNLYYNTGNGVLRYNGNVSSMTWKSGNETTLRGYKFTYDGLNRLKEADYGEGLLFTGNTGKFSEKITGYDKHGNIQGLKRYGHTTTTGNSLVDDLSFGYTGNRLKYVNDAIASSHVASGQTFHFLNGSNSTADEYMYDANGNLIKDSNKNIIRIEYNFLNLPKKVEFSEDRSTTYVYDVTGIKRKVTHQGSGINQTTDYCGNVIYENGVLSKILMEEGYITFSGTVPVYHYYLKDHLGNNRVVLHQNGTTVEQVNHYYPFGGLFDQISESLQSYKYNGKELDRTYGIDLYDYSARYMDGTLGRFMTMDPMVEKYYRVSPYVYCKNSPILRIDPDGKDDWEVNQSGYFQKVPNTKSNTDKIYVLNDDNERLDIVPMEVEKGMLDDIQLYVKFDDPFSPDAHALKTANEKEAKGLFEFLADNTKVEWSYAITDGKGKNNYIVTSHEERNEKGFIRMFNKIFIKGNLLMHIHNHPRGIPDASDLDKLFRDEVKTKFPNAIFKIYISKKGDKYYEY